MEPLTTVIARVIRKHPFGAPYVLVCSAVVAIIGFHPW